MFWLKLTYRHTKKHKKRAIRDSLFTLVTQLEW